MSDRSHEESASSPALPSSKRATGWRRDVVFLILLLAPFFAFMLGSRALWSPDEGRYAEIPREMLASGDYVTPRLNGVKYFEKPPLGYWMEAAAIAVFGLNEWALRLPIALMALAGCLGTYAAGRRMFGRRVGLLAAGVLATCPLYYLLARSLTLDMPVSVLMSGSLLAFVVAVHEPAGAVRRWLLHAFYALAAMAVLTKGLVGLVIPGLVIGAWMLLLGDWRIPASIQLPSGIAIVLVIAVPWHVLVARAAPEFAWFYFIHEHVLRYATRLHDRYQPVWYFLPVLLVGACPWIVFLPTALRSAVARRREDSEQLFLAVWMGVVLAFFSASGSKLFPYVLPLFPALSLCIARWLDEHWDEDAVSLRYAAVGALVLAATAVGALAVEQPWLSFASARATENAVSHRCETCGLYFLALGLGTLPWLFRRSTIGRLTPPLLVGTAILCCLVSVVLPHADIRRSVRSLAREIRVGHPAADEIMAYRVYPQDLPVYVERLVTVVDWQGELEFGVQSEPATAAWMIGVDEFWRRWEEPRCIYLVARSADYEALASSGRGVFRRLGEYGDYVLVTNGRRKGEGQRE